MHLIKATEKTTLTLQARDAEGNVVAFTPRTPPVWGTSSPETGDLIVSADGLSAELFAGAPTTGQVNVQADIAQGDDPARIITGILEIQVLPGDAETFAIVPGPNVPQGN